MTAHEVHHMHRTADYLDRPARQTSTAEFYLEVERGTSTMNR